MRITTRLLTNRSTDQGQRVYRLRKCFAAVQFDQDTKGRIVFLPAGAEPRVAGSSRVDGCLEVLIERQTYHMFEIDLLGPWSYRIERSPSKSARIEPGRAAIPVGACA